MDSKIRNRVLEMANMILENNIAYNNYILLYKILTY